MFPDLSTQSPYFLPALVGAIVVLILLMRVRIVGTLIRTLISLAFLAGVTILLLQRAPFDPLLSRIVDSLKLDGQEVVGNEVRIPLSANGHFMARVSINGVERRMLIDSGATVTALSVATATAAGVEPQADLLPVVLQTANGAVQAQTATIESLRLGTIKATDLKAVVSPALGDMDLLGMNFLSKLKSWRVEGRTLILVPHHPQPPA